ncbi:TPA: acyl carrier protein [Campylobacter jejuni]|nr:acyl carrier protein [Campylobacter jejuni]
MEKIKYFFDNIGRTNVDENTDYLIENGILDSLGIINLIEEIESFYDINIDFDYITQENFRNFQSIKNMIEKIINEKN